MTPKKNRPEPSLRQQALDLLARREYSAHELQQRLAAAGHDADAIAELVTDFAARGWLSDERFAGQVVRARSQRFGRRRIEQELRSKGVQEATIEQALQDSPVDDAALARSLWQKKFAQPPATAQEKARQVRYLVNRGFALGLVLNIVGGKADDDGWPPE